MFIKNSSVQKILLLTPFCRKPWSVRRRFLTRPFHHTVTNDYNIIFGTALFFYLKHSLAKITFWNLVATEKDAISKPILRCSCFQTSDFFASCDKRYHLVGQPTGPIIFFFIPECFSNKRRQMRLYFESLWVLRNRNQNSKR